MKAKVIVGLMVALLLFSLPGCGQTSSSDTAPASTTSESSSEEKQSDEKNVKEEKPTEISYDNLPLCHNDKVDVTLSKISDEGIKINITNKTDDIVSISQAGIALDGQCLMNTGYALLYEDLVPNSTLEHLIPYELDEVEHQTISGVFELMKKDEDGNGWNDGYLSFSNVDLGHDAHPLWADSPDAQILYEDDQVVCSFYRILGSQFAVSITNKGSELIRTLCDSISVNGQMISEMSSDGADILPGCESILIIDLLDYDLESEVKSGDTIAGIFDIFGQDHMGTGNISFSMTVK